MYLINFSYQNRILTYKLYLVEQQKHLKSIEELDRFIESYDGGCLVKSFEYGQLRYASASGRGESFPSLVSP
jgi:hypothetical protein